MATSIDSMGKLNNAWGICGFASALYSLYEHSPKQRAQLAPAGETNTRMLAEIKTYLKMLQADDKVVLLGKIQIFTRSFGGQWADFEIDKYIERINAVVKSGVVGDFSIAMPPEAVVDYLQRVCDFKSARILTGNELEPKELILGLSRTGMNMYNSLAHWVYELNGTIYSWGKQFPSRQSVMSYKNYTGIAYKIAIT